MSNPKGFTKADLNDKLFKDILKGIDNKAILKSWTRDEGTQAFGFVTETLNKSQNKETRMLGLFSYDIEYILPNRQENIKKRIMIKSKARSNEMIDSFAKLIPDSEPEFLKIFCTYADQLDFQNAEYRELHCVQINDKTLKSLMPEIYWSWTDPDNDIFVFAMEYLEPENISHMNSINDMKIWQENDTFAVLDGLALLHAKFYNQYTSLPEGFMKYTNNLCTERLTDFVPLWEACADRNLKTGIWTDKGYDVGKQILSHLPEISAHLASLPKTFVHGDAHVMNLGLRKNTSQDKHRLCMFDWEICSIGPLHQDIAFFLWFHLPENADVSLWHYYIKKYYAYFKHHLGTFQKENTPQSLENTDILVNKVKEGNEKDNNPESGYLSFQKDFDMFISGMYISRLSWTCCILGPAYNPPYFPRLMGNLEEYVSYITKKYNFV